jgi:hypothetical protein
MSPPPTDASAAEVFGGTGVVPLEVLNDLSSSELSPRESWRELRAAVTSGRVRPDRLAKASKTEPAGTRARLSELLIDAGMAGLAVKVPPADPRVRERALASLK